MSEQFQLRRGSKSENDAFTGQPGEMSVVTDVPAALRIHDGITTGGVELARADLANVENGAFNGLGALANSLTQGAVGVNLIKFDSSGIAIFENELEGSRIQLASLPFDRLISSSTDAILRFDGSGNLTAQLEIENADIEGPDTVPPTPPAITTAKIKTNSIPNEKFVPGSITFDKITDDSIATDRIAAGAAEALKFEDGSVTTDKIANSNITADKIVDAGVLTNHIVDETIGKSKIGTSVITGGKLSASTGNAFGARFVQEDPPLNSQGDDGDIAYVTTLVIPPVLPPSTPASVSITFDGVGRLTKPAAGSNIATDSSKFTISWWTRLDANVPVGAGKRQVISINDDNNISVLDWRFLNGNNTVNYFQTINNVVSANATWDVPLILGRWHHCLLQYDANASVSDSQRRETLRFYFDGVELVASLGPSSGAGSGIIGTSVPSWINNTQIIKETGHTLIDTLTGKTAEWYLIDGLIVPPSAFVTNGSGAPILYTGPFGNAGYHLDFKDTGDLGKDISGNGNDWQTVATVSPNPDGPPSPPPSDDLVSAWFDGDVDFLSRVVSTTQNQTSWTVSCWFQLNNLKPDHTIFSSSAGGTRLHVSFTGNKFLVQHTNGPAVADANNNIYRPLFRDSAWYHLVLVWDTNNSVESERVRVFINGNRIERESGTYPLGITASLTTAGQSFIIGNVVGIQDFNGYISQFAFLSGKSNSTDANEFGSFVPVGTGDNAAIWKAKTNTQIVALVNSTDTTSFILGENIGDGLDSSSHGNNFSPSSMTHALNGSVNSPSNLHMIFNPLQNFSWNFLDGNKICTGLANIIANYQALGNIYAHSGKFHIEIDILGTGAAANGYGVGIAPRVADTQGGASSGHTTQPFGQVMYDSGVGIIDASDGVMQITPSTPYTNGDRITMAVDFDNNVINFFKNGIGIAVITPKRPISEEDYTVIVGDRSSAAVDIRYRLRSEPSEFQDTPLTGFVPWNTRNVSTPQFQGADFFNAVTYTGNGVASVGSPVVAIDPNDLIPGATLSNGNLTANLTGLQEFGGIFSLSSVDAGNADGFYVEFTLDANSNPSVGLVGVGFVSTDHDSNSSLNNTSNTMLYNDQGQNIANGQVFNSAGATWAPGDTIAAFVKNNTVEFFKNGVSQFVGATIFGGVRFAILYSSPFSPTVIGTVNFGDTPFVNTPPVGAQNMPAVITGGQTISNVGFSPDLTWIKARNQSLDNMLTDTLRGENHTLRTNSLSAETIDTNALTAFVDNGFVVGDNTAVNSFNNKFVSWNWKADGTVQSNTEGTIETSVSVAAPGHFSIATFTGNGLAATIGHGLPGTPDAIIVKSRDTSNVWYFWTNNIGMDLSTNNSYLALDFPNGLFTDGNNVHANTPPTSTSTTISSFDSATNVIGEQYVSYSFRNVPGICKVGTYKGNANAIKSPFIHTGFKPRWILIKSTSTTDWIIIDTARDEINPISFRLKTNSNGIELTDSVADIDILADGFRIRSSNSSINGSLDYIYIAMAQVAGNGSLPPIPGSVGGPISDCIDQLVQNPTGFSTWDGATSFYIFTGQNSIVSQNSGTNSRANIRKIDSVIKGDFEVTWNVSGNTSATSPNGFVGVYDAAKDAQFLPSNGGNNFGGGFFGSAPAHGSAPGNIAFGYFFGSGSTSSVSNQFTDDGVNSTGPVNTSSDEYKIKRVNGETVLLKNGTLFHTFNANFSGDMRLFICANGDGFLFPVANLRVCSL